MAWSLEANTYQKEERELEVRNLWDRARVIIELRHISLGGGGFPLSNHAGHFPSENLFTREVLHLGKVEEIPDKILRASPGKPRTLWVSFTGELLALKKCDRSCIPYWQMEIK